MAVGITGLAAQITFMGNAVCWMRGEVIHFRQRARAFVVSVWRKIVVSREYACGARVGIRLSKGVYIFENFSTSGHTLAAHLPASGEISSIVHTFRVLATRLEDFRLELQLWGAKCCQNVVSSCSCGGGLVVRLRCGQKEVSKKAVYGTRDADMCWDADIASLLVISMEFVQSRGSACNLYNKDKLLRVSVHEGGFASVGIHA